MATKRKQGKTTGFFGKIAEKQETTVKAKRAVKTKASTETKRPRKVTRAKAKEILAQAVQLAEAVPPPAAPKPSDVSATCTDPLAAKFDVRNLSSRQLMQMSMELYQAGRISRECLAMLSFQPEMSASYDRVGTLGLPRPDADEPRDVLAEWEAILEMQTRFENSAFFTDKTREVIGLLSDLDRARKGVE